MIPNNINKEHLNAAIAELDQTGIPKGRKSFKYDLIHKGKRYPPLLVVSIANRIANGKELPANTLNGGPSSEAFKLLKSQGFETVEKTKTEDYQVIDEFIEKIRKGKFKAAKSVNKLIKTTNFEANLKVIDAFFFDTRLSTINSVNYKSIISYLEGVHKIKDGIYNDFNIWSASKNLLNKTNSALIEEHDKLNQKVGFPDNGNGLFKSFLGKKNLIAFIESKFESELNMKKKYWLYSPGRNARKWDEFYQLGIIGLGWDELGDLKQYNSSEEIKKVLDETYGGKGTKTNTIKANEEFASDMNIGDVVIVKKGRHGLLGFGVVDSNYEFDNSRSEFKSIRRVDWKKKGSWYDEDHLAVKTLTDITEYKTIHEDYNKYYERLMALMQEDSQVKKTKKTMFPLNTILYGPPGTGKTYNTINYALSALGVDISDLNRPGIMNLYQSKIDSGEIVFTTFHQSISYEDFIEGIKPETKDGEINYKIQDGLFKEFCLSKPLFEVNDVFGSRGQYKIVAVSGANLRIGRDSGMVDLSMDFINEMLHLFFSDQITVNDFKTENRDQLRELFPTKWDKYLFGYESMYKGVLQYAGEKNLEDSDKRKVLIIDEINRGNVSNVFGELITLIEEDKRMGNANYTPVKLPYSKDLFGVPNNLYIIGTMNTADRSVEALDTALRRRFSFIEMNPDPAKLSAEEFKCKGVDLESLLGAINGRIEKLLDKDYCIGHSYFMTIQRKEEPLEELKTIFKNKILPLLQEYFYGDWGKIQLVIGSAFVETNKTAINFLNSDSYEDLEEYDEKPIYNFTDSSSWTLESFKSIYA